MSGILFVKLLFHEGNGDFHEAVAEVNGGKGGNHKHEKRPSADVKASELAKKTEIPAFIYDMTEKEARDFRLRGNAKGAPPGKLLPENEIGKKREAPAKTPDKAAENKTPVTQPKPSEKAAEVKVAPTPAQKKQEEKPKAAAPTEKADADGKTPVMPPKSPDKAADAKPAPAPEAKKPEEKPKAVPSLENEDADGKKPDISPKPLEKPAEIKPTPTPEL